MGKNYNSYLINFDIHGLIIILFYIFDHINMRSVSSSFFIVNFDSI